MVAKTEPAAYYIAPNGKVGADAFGVIRDAIEDMKMVALGRVVLTSREHIIALEPRGKGLVGTLLRYPYEVRDQADYFEDVPEAHITRDMLELARHIVKTKKGQFEPKKFEDHYEEALRELFEKKQKGEEITAPKEHAPAKVINLMDALRRSVEGAEERRPPALSQRTRRSTGKRASHSTARRRKAG